jgi:hypothetical protein
MSMFDAVQSTVFDDVANNMPAAGTVSNFYVHMANTGTGWTYTVYKNGAPTIVQCTITVGQDCTAGALSVAFAPGDKIAILETKGTGAAGASDARWSATY